MLEIPSWLRDLQVSPDNGITQEDWDLLRIKTDRAPKIVITLDTPGLDAKGVTSAMTCSTLVAAYVKPSIFGRMCAVLCYAEVWCDVAGCGVLCCAVLCCAVAVLCCAVLWLSCAVVQLCCAVLWCNAMWCGAVWYDVIWHHVMW